MVSLRSARIEHKRGTVRVPGLSEAVELIFRHEFSLRLKDAKTFVLQRCEKLRPSKRDGPAAGCLPLEAAGGE